MRLIVGLLVTAVVATTGWFIKEHLKESAQFCVSCHLTDTKSLHADKYARMRAVPPESLAGVHFQLQTKKIVCADCHRGFGIEDRLLENWLELKNSFVYFFGSVREPEKTVLAVKNKACLPCHNDLLKPEKDLLSHPRFHSLQAHDGIDKPLCADCHRQHNSKGRNGSFLEKATLVRQCKTCHQKAEDAVFIRNALRIK